MGQITSLFVRKVASQVDAKADIDALMRSVGVEPEAPIDASQMVSDTDYYAFLERCAAVDCNAVSLPLRVGATMRCEDYGAFGLAWKSAPDLLGSYQRAERYARVLTSVSEYELERVDAGVDLRLRREGERRLGLRLSNEATIASIVSISREASTGTFRPIAALFRHPAPDSTAAHEEAFGCPVHFGTDRDALRVSMETLRAPNKVGDVAIARFFDSHLESGLVDLEEENVLESRVRDRVSRSLSGGVPLISEVASQLGMSGRSLQRRLSESGSSYQELVDEARRGLAKRLLEGTGYSLAEISFMTGFAEQSSLSRAFKRWTGRTPGSYRLAAR